MKKNIKIWSALLLLVSIMAVPQITSAATTEQLDLIPNGSYIIGDKTLSVQTFTRDEMFAAIRSITGTNHILYKDYTGAWSNVYKLNNVIKLTKQEAAAAVQTTWQPGELLSGFEIKDNKLTISKLGVYTASYVGKNSFDEVIVNIPKSKARTANNSVAIEGISTTKLTIKSTQQVVLTDATINEVVVDAANVKLDSTADIKAITINQNGAVISVEGNPTYNKGQDVNDIKRVLDLSEIVSQQTTKLISTYYNKFNSGDILSSSNINAEIYYLDLGAYLGTENPSELKIGSNTYDLNNKTLSIGRNAKIEAPVWKIANGHLYIALTWLAADSLPEQMTKITVGGTTLEVSVYADSVKDNSLTISNVGVLGTVAGYINEATITNASKNEITYNYGHGKNYIGVELSLNGTKLLDSSLPIFRKSPNGSMGITSPEAGFTYALYPKYAAQPVTKEETFAQDYKIAVPNQGVITIHFIMKATLKEVDVADQVTKQTNELIATYFNKYQNGTVLDETKINQDIYYVNLGKYYGSSNPEELLIGTASYNKAVKTLSIGNNAKIKSPVWKIYNNNVYVALTWLTANALPGKLVDIVVGGQTIRVNVYNKTMTENALSLTGVGTLFTQNSHTNEAVITDANTITYRTGHNQQAIGIKLSLDNNEIIDKNQVIFRLAPNGSMGITTPERNYTYVLYPRYVETPVTEEKEYTQDYKIALPNQGVITIRFVVNEVIDVIS